MEQIMRLLTKGLAQEFIVKLNDIGILMGFPNKLLFILLVDGPGPGLQD